MWTPVTPLMLAGTVRQLCHPPVLAMAKSPMGGLLRLSRRTWTRPLTPLAAPEATRAENCPAAVAPKLTPVYSAQSPLAIQPMFWPPPVSLVASVWIRDGGGGGAAAERGREATSGSAPGLTLRSSS